MPALPENIQNPMRIIKFRAWDGKEFLPLAREVAFIDDSGALRSRIEGIVFSQFTGLIDRLGKEIYEGDIVMVEGADSFVVVREYASFLIKNSEWRFHLGEHAHSVIKVIGNVYANPELLKEQS